MRGGFRVQGLGLRIQDFGRFRLQGLWRVHHASLGMSEGISVPLLVRFLALSLSLPLPLRSVCLLACLPPWLSSWDIPSDLPLSTSQVEDLETGILGLGLYHVICFSCDFGFRAMRLDLRIKVMLNGQR